MKVGRLVEGFVKQGQCFLPVWPVSMVFGCSWMDCTAAAWGCQSWQNHGQNLVWNPQSWTYTQQQGGQSLEPSWGQSLNLVVP